MMRLRVWLWVITAGVVFDLAILLALLWDIAGDHA